MAGSKDKSFLILRGTTWLVSVKVPAHLRTIVGKAHLRQTTGTDSLSRANAIKHGIVQALKSSLAQAQKEHEGQLGGAQRSRVREAMEWRHDLSQAKEADRQDPEQDALDITTSLLADRADEIAEREGMTQAKEFHAIATGKATPISTLVDSWIAERPMKPRQVTDYRRAVSKFTAWLTSGDHPTTIEKVLQGVLAVPFETPAVIRTDSTYVRDGTTRWRRGWQARGMRTKDGTVKNADLWPLIWEAIDARPLVRIEWVRGHSGERGNEIVDKIATAAAERRAAGGRPEDGVRTALAP